MTLCSISSVATDAMTKIYDKDKTTPISTLMGAQDKANDKAAENEQGNIDAHVKAVQFTFINTEYNPFDWC